MCVAWDGAPGLHALYPFPASSRLQRAATVIVVTPRRLWGSLLCHQAAAAKNKTQLENYLQQLLLLQAVRGLPMHMLNGLRFNDTARL